ncbi:MAG: DUF2064 domain-containing protein [Betaproteobacteria bacterium AqS2]|uniref:DUF2064 domain-containing protein n=1 Tax=Candidatus Amphirhobacter heronislandensis TaxID=1732024 RepID=A0A930XW81_9GAMM|nr:DUF2064 domain-containing protein [Betaproteobacteria bacterium AqS2]
MSARAAAAIFVRTPGLSASKTRLAAEVGGETAARLYGLALACAKELAAGLAAEGVAVFWAVAEADGVDDPVWRATGLPSVHSGGGDLGACLARVYGRLRAEADAAILLGSDSPQLTAADLRPAWAADAPDFVAGPAADGGFYLFAGRRDVPAEIWREVEYSAPTTLAQLEEKLAAPVARLGVQPDFDDLASLRAVRASMPAAPSAAQAAFAAAAAALDQSGRESLVSARNMP